MKFYAACFSPLALVIALSFSMGRNALSQTATTPESLAQFRTALEKIARGDLSNARLLLESTRDRGQIASENALILAFLQEKSGDGNAALQTLRQTLGQTQNLDTSSLARAYATQLGAPTSGAEAVFGVPQKLDTLATLNTVSPGVNRLEKMMLSLVNAERIARNRRILMWDDNIAAIARAHSAEMRDRGYFAHESPTPGLRQPLDRYRAAMRGASPRMIGENVYRAWRSNSSLSVAGVREGHAALMQSPGHRENILQTEVEKIGIGIVSNSNGDIWITQVFVKE